MGLRFSTFLTFLAILLVINSCRFHDTDRQQYKITPQISLGEDHSCLLAGEDEIFCWGLGDYGRWGDGRRDAGYDTDDTDVRNEELLQYYTQRTTTGNFSFQAISAGRDFNCGITNDERVVCWGGESPKLNFNGNINITTDRYLPSNYVLQFQENDVAIAFESTSKIIGNILKQNAYQNSTEILFGVKKIDAGYRTACAVTEEGAVRCWGTGAAKIKTSVSPIIARPNVSGYYDSAGDIDLYLTTAGDLEEGGIPCIDTTLSGIKSEDDGIGAAIKIAEGVTVTENSPINNVNVQDLQNASDVSLGFGHACALMNDGTVKCWGRYCDASYDITNKIFQTTEADCIDLDNVIMDNICPGKAIGSTIYLENRRLLALTVPEVSNAIDIQSGEGHSCALINDGTVKCWGQNDKGQVGNGTTTDVTTATTVSGITTAKSISLGEEFSCALMKDGQVKCWGNASRGQLGSSTYSASSMGVPDIDLTSDSDNLRQTSPLLVSGLKNVRIIDVGFRHSCAITSELFVQCWGESDMYKLGDHKSTFIKTITIKVSPSEKETLYIPSYTPVYVDPCSQNPDGSLACFANVNYNY